MLDITGLILIVLGWSIQLFARTKTIQPAFPICYALGVLLLVIQGFLSGNFLIAGLNLVAVVLAGGVLLTKK
jgi:hypothetical protein